MRGITTVGLVLFGVCAIANAGLVDNFQSYTLNTWPSSSGWTMDGNADGLVVADPDPTNPSNQVLRLYGKVGEYWATLAYYPQSFPDEFILKTSVYNGSEYILGGGHHERAIIGLRTGAAWPGWTNPARDLLIFNGDGTVLGSEWDPIGTYNTQQWYDVTIHYRRNAQDVSVQYWLDGVDLGAHTYGLAAGSQSIERGFDHINLTAGAGTAYFDDIEMKVVPLPGSVFLAFTAVSLVGWRLRGRTV